MNFDTTFFDKVFNGILLSSSNSYVDNEDYLRFPKKKTNLKNNIKTILKLKLEKKGFFKSFLLESMLRDNSYQCFEFLYNNLNDQSSKDLLVQVYLFRLLGKEKVKLPLSKNYEHYLSSLENIAKDSKEFGDKNLFYFDLTSLGYNLKMHISKIAVLADFYAQQYRYSNDDITIEVTPGDIVIDGGGCYGDTALLFGSLAKENGKVFSFEFNDENLLVFNENIKLNQLHNIQIVKEALWHKSGDFLSFTENNASTSVTYSEDNLFKKSVRSISIDDFVEKKNPNSIDFIKLDIEGAELEALHGTEKVLRKFKPNLAIALYHRIEDFYKIPEYIKSLNLGYKLYFGHATIHSEESILFATTK